MNKFKSLTILATGIFLFTACKKDKFVAAVVEQKEILANASASGNYVLYSLENGIVSNTDSATIKWDFGMRFDKFIINSNASGPGTALVQIIDGSFDNYNTAPETNYAYDTTSTQLAIKGANWYSYDVLTHSFVPKAGKVFIFKTNGNHYAKMEMLSADATDNNGVIVTPPTYPTKIKYKFRKAVQLDGTRIFN